MDKMTLEEFKEKSNMEIIQDLINLNGGYITSKQITEMGLHRMYLNIMVSKGIIEKVNKGIYIDKNILEDDYYTFQLKYPKTIYARFTALYFWGLTEILPNVFDLSVDYNYHVSSIDKKHNIYKCKKEYLNIGLTTFKTLQGHFINIYDRERCICDIIKYRKRLDIEQVKKSVKLYIKDENKNLINLSTYAKEMHIYKEVMEFVGMFYE